MKLIVSTNVLPMYRFRLFKELISRGQQRGIEVEILLWATDIEGRGWRDNLTDELPVQLASQLRLDSKQRVGPSRANEVLRALRRLQPDVVLSTGFGLPTIGAALPGRRRPRLLIWSEAVPGIPLDARRLRLAQRRMLAGRADGFVVPGTAASRYVRSIHRTKPVLQLLNCVDTDVFRPIRSRSQQQQLHAVSVGRLADDKAIPSLLPAMTALRRQGKLIAWTVIGDGPAATDFVSAARDGLSGAFHWRPKATSREVASSLAEADIFVLTPHVERWGFAVQEAVMTGLPVVISDEVGCIPDLVIDGVTGVIVSPPPRTGRAAWVSRLVSAIEDAASSAVREKSRTHALALRAAWSPGESASRFLDELDAL
jgi:glycosyltransferase involved in cell wall biosynthesis